MSGTSVMTPPTPVAAPSKRASVASRLAISASSRPSMRRTGGACSAAQGSAAGPAAAPPPARCAPGAHRVGAQPLPQTAGGRLRAVWSRRPIADLPALARRTVSAMDREVVDAGRRLRRRLHAAARHHDRERRAAVDRARPGRRPSPTCSGSSTPTRSRSPALLLTGGLARGPRRPPARVRDRPRGLHRRLAAVRPGRTSPLTLNLARALQGVGGAFMFATSLALLASAYRGRDRGTAFGLWGARPARRWRSARWSAAC